MKHMQAKKLLIGLTILSTVTAIGAVTYADAVLKEVTAYQNANLKVAVNGKPIDLSSEDGPMYPLVYNGHSYVSAKAIAEALGATIQWDASTETVIVSSGHPAPLNTDKATDQASKTDKTENKIQLTSQPIAPSPQAPTAPAAPTSGNSLTEYPEGTSQNVIFENGYALADAVFLSFARALKTGNTSQLESVLSQVQDTFEGENKAGKNVTTFRLTLSDMRYAYNITQLDQLSEGITAAVNAKKYDTEYTKVTIGAANPKDIELDYSISAPLKKEGLQTTLSFRIRLIYTPVVKPNGSTSLLLNNVILN